MMTMTSTPELDIEMQEQSMRKLVESCLPNFMPPPDMTVSEWADANRRLSSENSAEAGQWRTSRTPYLAEIMDAFTDPYVEKIVVTASSQVGKTEMLMNMLGYVVDIDPGPVMYCMPTVDNAEDFSKRRLEPMIRDTEPVRRKMAASKSRSSGNTILKKRFPGGMLTLVGSNSPANLASVPARYVFGDEIDRWAKDAGGEGDPAGLLEARTATFWNKKIVMVSTPTVKGASAIETEFMLGTQEYWSAKCPHCGEYHFVTFDDIRFDHERLVTGDKIQFLVSNISYLCPDCGCLSSEGDMAATDHKWVSKRPEAAKNGTRSFWINAFSSPWVPWEHIIKRFLEAKDDPAKLKVVYNTLLGQLWEERGEIQDTDVLEDSREEYEAELPDGVLCLTCGVDTQDNRLEFEVVGHGMFDETWGIERGVLWGKPDAPNRDGQPNVWSQLDSVLDRQWSYKDGKTLRISVTFVDSGGHYTQEVYRECAARMSKRVFPVKGRGGEGVPYTSKPSKQAFVSADSRGRKKSSNVWLYVLGVDAGKEKIMSALQVREPGPRYCHFPFDESRGYDAAFFDGLVSERLVLMPSGNWQWRKVTGHRRNEALDCRNYANAAFSALAPDMDKLKALRKGANERTAPQTRRRRRGSKGVQI